MFKQTFSLHKLNQFVGREAILDEVGNWIRDGKLHLIFLNGEYGVGKTRLLQRILDLTRNDLKYDGAPTHLIDLYHFHHHSPESLARAIVNCFLNTDNAGYFNSFITTQRRLDAARAGGDSKAIHESLQKLLHKCIEGLTKMSAERGVILLFDTIEQFVYPTDSRFAPAWDWMKEWISDIPHGLVLFAGRPSAQALFKQISVTTIHLDAFTSEECRSYLEANAKRWFQETGLSFSFAEQEAQTLYNLSQGRPILLAIFLELRIRDPQVLINLSEFQIETFEQKIIDFLLSLPELGETLKAVGRMPKGVNAELLAKIRGISVRDAMQALTALKEMSFAKTFPDNDRVFLHDEMYTLLEKYVYSDEADTVERQEAAQNIYEYYKQAIKQKDKELRDIFVKLTQEIDLEQDKNYSEDYVSKIRILESYRQLLKTEFTYFRLRNQISEQMHKAAYLDDPIQSGLKNYYRFGHEAATSNNDEILLPLQIELTNFWLRLEKGNDWKPFIEGLLLINHVWLKVATAQNYWEEIPTHEMSLASIPNLSNNQKTILHALLKIWMGTGLVFSKQPDYDQAEMQFTNSINDLLSLSGEQQLKWFKDVVLSLAYRQHAYMRRIRGAFQDAIEDFKSGLRYSRSINFFHEEATLRNDLGLAEMQMGAFQSSFENIWDGLQLRYQVAIGHRIALSHSSLAQHFISTGAYEEARKHSLNAIRVAEAVGFRRGLAFAYLANAESTRRFSFSIHGSFNQAEYLKQAQDAADIAIHLLDQIGEKARIIDAKLEQACLYRDRLRLETDPSKKNKWFEKSDVQLLEVAKAAEEAGIEYRQVDAICNRIWLGYYANELDYAEQASSEFERLDVLKPYWLKNGKFVNEAQALKNLVLWAQIGKYHIVRSIMALKQWGIEKEDKILMDAARHMMLGIMYNKTFAEDHRGIREGRRTIYKILVSLNPDELRTFSNYVLEAEKSEKVPRTPSALQLLMRDHALWFAD